MERKRLRAAHAKKHWTLEKAAEAIGVGVNTLHAWEKGHATPYPFSRERACEVYGATAAELDLEDPIETSKKAVEPGFIAISSEELSQTTDSVKIPLIEASSPLNTLSLPAASQHDETRLPFSTSTIKDIMEAVNKLEKENNQDMDASRRIIVAGLLSLISGMAVPLEWWEHLTHSQPSPMTIEEFNYFQQLVESCWGLCNGGEWRIAEQVLDSFLFDAIRHASKQREAALLAAQGLVLQSILQAHQLKLANMVPLCQQAVLYAKRAEDHTTLCASLNGLAVAFKYNQQLEESFKSYLEALSYCDNQTSPLVRSRIYAGAAAAFARKGRKQESDLYIHLAYECFPDHPEQDPHFLSADHGLYMISYYHGLSYLALDQPDEALQAFEHYKAYQPMSAVPQRNQLEIINHQGKASILSNDPETYALYLKDGINGALELRSRKRLGEVVDIFRQDMPKSWLTDRQIKPIVEQYPLLLQEMT